MKRLLALAASAAFLAACASGPKIRSNTAPDANLAAYKTYGFAPKLGTDRGGDIETPLTGYFKEAVRREMDLRGYRFVEGGDADLLVNFAANAKENVDVRSTPTPTYGVGYGYYGYRAGMYGGWYGGSEVETVRYKVGTANIDVVDAKKKQLLWEGIAEGRLSDKAMENPRGAVNAVITEIFKQFPGGAGGAAPATGTSS